MSSWGGSPDGFDDFAAFGLWGEFDDVDVLSFEFDDEFLAFFLQKVELFELIGGEGCICCGGIIGAEEEKEPEAVFSCVGEVEAVVEGVLGGFKVAEEDDVFDFVIK